MPIIYRPDSGQMYPNNDTIDPSVDNDFTSVVDGKTCIAYRLFVYDIDNTLVAGASTSRVDLPSTIYDEDTLSITLSASSLDAGEDYKWKVWMYANDKTVSSIDTGTNIITATSHGFSTGDLCVIKSDTTQPAGTDADTIYYVRRLSSSTIKLYDDYATAVSNGTEVDITSVGAGTITLSQVASSNAVIFYSSSDPSLSLTISSPHASQEIEAIPVYTQAEGEQVKFFKARLFDSNGNTLTDSGNIYSSNVRYTFDGLLDGESYSIQFDLETDLNQTATTGKISFDVDYTEPSTDLVLSVENVEDKSAILLSWNAIKPTVTVTGTEAYISDFIYTGNKGVQLETGESIEWSDDVEVDFDGTQHFIVRKDDLSTGVLFRMDNDYDSSYIEIGWDGTQFYTNENGSVINWIGHDALNQFTNDELAGLSHDMLSAYGITPNTNVYFMFILKDNKLYMKYITI